MVSDTPTFGARGGAHRSRCVSTRGRLRSSAALSVPTPTCDAAILSPDSQLARRGVVGPPGPMEDQGSTQFNLSMSQLHTFLNSHGLLEQCKPALDQLLITFRRQRTELDQASAQLVAKLVEPKFFN